MGGPVIIKNPISLDDEFMTDVIIIYLAVAKLLGLYLLSYQAPDTAARAYLTKVLAGWPL